jgi:hypothetical protein
MVAQVLVAELEDVEDGESDRLRVGAVTGPVDAGSEQFKICPSVGRYHDHFAVQDGVAERGETGQLREPVGPFGAGARPQPGREGFTWARQRYPSRLLSCTQPSAAGGAGTAVGSIGREGAVMSPTSVADPGLSRSPLGA